MGTHSKPKALRLWALGLAVCGILAFVTLAPTCPALEIDTGRDTISVPLRTSFVSFMANMKNRAGAVPTVTDWDPWLQAYPVAVIASVGVAPVMLLLASLVSDVQPQFVSAAAVILWAGNLAAGVYYLTLLSYSGQNTTSSCNVVPGLCAGPLLIGSAFLSQVVLLFSRL
jgi:hypothetical protein